GGDGRRAHRRRGFPTGPDRHPLHPRSRRTALRRRPPGRPGRQAHRRRRARRGPARPHPRLRRRRRRRRGRRAHPRRHPGQRPGPPQHPGGRVPAPHRPDAGGLTMAHPAVSVLEWQLVVYRRTWRAGLLGYFVIPVLFLLGIGLGLGGYVDQGGRLGVDYLAYIAPGLMVASAMGIAAGEATWPVLAYL